MSAGHVILLHGLWMPGISLLPLARRLREANFSVDTFEYATVATDPVVAAERLVKRLRDRDGETVHLVGHSLGGLVALMALQSADDLPQGRVVCLGSPLNGSAIAARTAQLPGGPWMLGRSVNTLRGGIRGWDRRCQVGVIAGSVRFGPGTLLGALDGPSDGTVAVSETRLPGIDDHQIIHVSHTGLLFSAGAAALTIAFLRSGRFGAGVDARRT